MKDGIGLGVSAGARPADRARGDAARRARAVVPRARGGRGTPPPLVARLDPAAPLAARWDGDFAALGKKLVPDARRARPRRARAARGSTSSATSSACSRRAAPVALSLPARLSLGGLTAEAARADPLRALEFEAVLAVPAGRRRGGRGTERLAPRPARRRARAARGRTRNPRLQTPSGEIAWKVDARAAGSSRRADAPGGSTRSSRRLAGGEPGLEGADIGRGGRARGAGSAAPRSTRPGSSRRCARSPTRRSGADPSGFVLRSLVERFVEPAARLAAISLRADLAEGALLLSLDVEGRAGAKER